MASAERELCTVSVIAHVSLFLLSLGAHLTFATSEATTSSVSDLNDVQLRIGTEFLKDVGHGRGRMLLQSMVPFSNGSLVLAADRTYRRDPLNGFRHYRGGWDIKNHSYWSSVGFTGLPGFLIALLWVALGLVFLVLFFGRKFGCRHLMLKEHDHGSAGYYIPLFLLILFSAAAIGGCYLLYWGQAKFHNELQSTFNYVVNQSYTTVQGLHNVSSYLSQASTINVESYGLPALEIQKIQNLNLQINQSAVRLQSRTETNSVEIQEKINHIRAALITISTVMLLLMLVGLVFAAIGNRRAVYMLVVIGWFLVVGTWILCGIFILLRNVMGDTCVAMQEWVAHPYARTSLDAILPCVDPQTGANTLAQSKETVNTITNNVNTAINLVINKDSGALVDYNQSGPAIPTLCNPYGPAPNVTETPCPNGTVDYATAPAVWAKYICPSNNVTCTGTGRLTQPLYNQLAAAANVSYGLRQYSPFLVDLQDCQAVRNAFTDITQYHCPGLRKYTKSVWIGMAIVSAGSMLTILLWMLYIRRRNMRYRMKNKTTSSLTPKLVDP